MPHAEPPPADAEPASESAQRRRERLILFVLAAVQFTTIVDFMVVMPLGPQLMRSLRIGPAEFGLIVSSYTFAAGAAGLIAAGIMDRFPRRTAFVALYAGFLLGTLFCAWAPTYQLLVAARVVTGGFGGILGGLAMAIIGDVFPDHRRGRATGILMSAFAVASVAGVPLGLYLGAKFGWHIPFIALAIGGAPSLALAFWALPPLDAHVRSRAERPHPLRALVDTFTHANHLAAFALIVSLMIGGFTVIPYISVYFLANVGMPVEHLPWVYVAGGAVTLVGAPVIGRLVDRYGKLRMYRVIAPCSAAVLLAITHLPPAPTIVAAAAMAALMLGNAGRMIAAMAMITGSVAPHRRGGFLSANASVQHIATGIGSSIGGFVITQSADGRLHHYGVVGWIAAATTLASLWLAGRVRPVDEEGAPCPRRSSDMDMLSKKKHAHADEGMPPEAGAPSAETLALPAAAEAACDAGEPLIGA